MRIIGIVKFCPQRVPQGCMLEPLLLDIYICGMFYDINGCNIASYADDNMP